MSKEDDAGSSSSSACPSLPTTNNESNLSETFSFAPPCFYQSKLGRPEVDCKLVPRGAPAMDVAVEESQVEHRNGENNLENGGVHFGNKQVDVDDRRERMKDGDVQQGGAELTGERDDLMTMSLPNLQTPVIASKDNGDPKIELYMDDEGAVDIELPYKFEKDDPPSDGYSAHKPERKLMATASAPARSLIGFKPSDSCNVGIDKKGDGGGSSVSSLKSDKSAVAEQIDGGTCDSGREVSLVRTISLPSGSVSEDADLAEYRRSSTQSEAKSRLKLRVKEKQNVRFAVHEKLSDRKKKKLMRHLATIQKDGTVEFDVAGSARVADNLFGPGIFYDGGGDAGEEANEEDEDKNLRDIPPLQIVMLIVGTRGDVQPFIAIGKHLQEYGHRVRLATHTNFREFVMTAGLEFYPLGGDPKVLAGYMVKNKGFLPSGPGEIQTQRKQIKAIINSLLPACIAPDTECGNSVAFRAEAIIANPPAYGHVHVAEYLQIPLHIFFTMPWTPTSQFPHPLSRVKSSAGYRMSYQVVDSLIWWGIRGMINDFRKKKLKLRPITYLSGAQGSIAELPTGYIWSPHLVPKPKDWGPLVDVVGFCLLDLAHDYKPPDDLMQWLKAGPAPIYVGFGSLPVVDPRGMTDIIVKALDATHQRGIIFKGWGGMGDLKDVPSNIFLIEDSPHDWLFKQCAAVVHHGGAGTTAAGLMAACPTTVVPFFGDQPFWGEQIHNQGVGPSPIPVDQFSLDKLVKAIEFMLRDDVKIRAKELSTAMANENGVEGAVLAFHKHLPLDTPERFHSYPVEKSKHRIFWPLKHVYGCFVSE